jgi:hypothetical protein
MPNLSDRVLDCYRRATECGERAAQASCPSIEGTFRKLERDWLELARRCELDENVYRLASALRSRPSRSA